MRDFVNKIYNCDNLELIKKLPNNSIDNFITDVPYALCDINGLDMIKNNSNNSGDFMNKKWLLPTVEMLKEFYRVLKTGGFFVTTFTPRQDLQTVFIYRLMEAGFDVSFSPIYWAYKSGFPKASNYAKGIDKHFKEQGECFYTNGNTEDRPLIHSHMQQSRTRAVDRSQPNPHIYKPTTPEAQYCDGLYSLSLKPALEPIIIAQKPHNKAKYKQALDWYYERKELLDKGIKEEDLSLYTKNSSGGCYIDSTRIPTSQEDIDILKAKASKNNNGISFYDNNIGTATQPNTQGRFPANLLCGFPISKEELRSEYPEATEEELDKMVNMIENPLDVGRFSKSSGALRRNNQSKTTGIENGASCYGKYNDYCTYGHDDTGDLSRYFSLTAWSKKHFPNLHNIAEKTLQLQDDVKKTGDCLFVNKPSQAEKNAGLDLNGREKNKRPSGVLYNQEQQAFEIKAGNTHPTTKPIALYNYLLSIFSREGDVILDPFCGSGTTPIACVLTNRRYIGIEMSEEYHKIAEARVEHYKQQKEAMKIPSASKKNVSASKSIDTNQGSLF